MKNKFNPDMDLIRIAFENANVPVRLVGGCVRDMLLGINPKDWDMTTPALPDDIISILRAANIECFDMSNGHGTITAVINSEPYEITTLRQDLETDGRHAVVGFTDDWKVDAERRDFTFNAMSMDFDGVIYDYFGGIADLKAGLVRFVGDAEKRIQEDYLRILRYFRFLGRMPKPEADVETLAIISANRQGLANISGERIWSEMKKIFSGEHVDFIMDLMDHSKITGAIDLMINKPAVPASRDPVTILAAYIDFAFVEIVCDRWKLSSKEESQLVYLTNFRNIIDDVKVLKEAIFEGTDRYYVLELMKIQHRKDDYEILKNWIIPTFPVSGKDLIEIGVKPGPNMGFIIKVLRKSFVESNYQMTKEQFLSMVDIDKSPE
ncbi:MAG: CCA tRNA nucleotidyltransferase [Gammaproteobacteria bacterium]|nr:CCA tRNA nucleotidyltransferase [Gammaproteobacteria bacterium]